MMYVCSARGCGRITPERRCERHRKRQEQPRKNHEFRRRYYTARWSRVRDLVLARDHHLCQQCKRDGKAKHGDQVDHIRLAMDAPELFWRLDNLQTLCRTCHSRKTAAGE